MCIAAVSTENMNSFPLLFNTFLSFHNVHTARAASHHTAWAPEPMAESQTG